MTYWKKIQLIVKYTRESRLYLLSGFSFAEVFGFFLTIYLVILKWMFTFSLYMKGLTFSNVLCFNLAILEKLKF